jgi:pimeloyl-ACP methyl ester carboxylesterase
MSFENATGGSGSLWIRLDNFQRTRDNMRQGVMDLLNLNATLSTIDLDGSGALNSNAAAAADFDVNNVSYVGHSLGAIVGTVFVAVNNDSNPNYGNTALPRIQKAILATPGGQVTKLVENSVGIGPSILAGLKGSNAELVPGKSLLESYMKVLQATIDSADPMNFIGKLAVGGDATTDVLIPGMYGDLASGKPSDLVVPISGEGVLVAADTYTLADGSTAQPESSRGPLIGLKPMLEILDADNVKDTPAKHQLFAKYNDGGHGTFSSAGTDTSATGFDSAAVFGEMLNQSVKFLGAGAILPTAVNPDVDVSVVTGDLLITGAP